MDGGLSGKRLVKDRIIERQSPLQMRSGFSKPARKHQVATEGKVTQNQAAGIVALTAETQQVLVQHPARTWDRRAPGPAQPAQ
jgi:hypothetical protein